jgi:glycosyltransferase involved in cell wall biosynthesis
MKKLNLTKQIIIHDHFEIEGGAENSIFFIARELNLKLFTFYKKNKINNKLFKIYYFNIKKNLHPLIRSLICFIFYFFYKFEFKSYDKVYLSGHFSLLLLRPNLQSKIIYICHSPPRFLTDQEKEYKKRFRFFYTFFFLNSFILFYKKLYQKKLKLCDQIICNSHTSKRRLIKLTKKKINIVYPLHNNLTDFRYNKSSGYYLSLSRLHWAKRVDDVVRVFSQNELKDKKLVVCSSGPEKEKIQKLIKKNKFKNIIFLGEVSQKQKIRLLSKCEAVIHIPINEEFGFVNLETLASGKLLITTNEGEFGRLLKNNRENFIIKNYSIEKLKKTIIKISKTRLNYDYIASKNINFAKHFGKKNFLKSFLQF